MEANEAQELQEHAEHAGHSDSLRPVALTMTILAVLVAVFWATVRIPTRSSTRPRPRSSKI